MAKDLLLFSTLLYDPRLAELPASTLNHVEWNHANASPFYMLNFHRDRMLLAATHWCWEKAVEALQGDQGLRRIAELLARSVGQDHDSPKRLKLLISRQGELSCELGPTPEKSLDNLFPKRLPQPGEDPAGPGLPQKKSGFQVVLDVAQTRPSELTHFKTTWRAIYDSARLRADISVTDQKEVLLVNENNGSIMEASLTTPYFFRNGRWVTPPVSRHFQVGSGSGGQNGTTRRWALQRGLAAEEDVKAASLVDGEECWLSNGLRGFFFGRVKLKS